jgi:hypothetical protein
MPPGLCCCRYWLGLKSSAWYYYAWTDGFTPGPDHTNQSLYYRHWGEGLLRDPNQYGASCASADLALAYNIPGISPAVEGWGWNDGDCSQLLPYVCKTPQCGWQLGSCVPVYPYACMPVPFAWSAEWSAALQDS